MKAIFVSFFVFIMSFSIAFGQSEDDFEYEIIQNGYIRSIRITKYFGNVKDVVIPSTISKLNGLPVTSIGKDAFHATDGVGGTWVSEVIFPDGTRRIDVNYSRGWDGINTVVIPTTVTEICDWAFAGNKNLKNIILPNGLVMIGNQAFSSCINLENINIPATVEYIGYQAFCECYLINIETRRYVAQKFGPGPFSDPK